MDQDFEMLIEKNNLEDRARGDKISRDIAQEIQLSAQIAILRKQISVLLKQHNLEPIPEFAELMEVAERCIANHPSAKE